VLDQRGQLLRAAQLVKTAWSESNAPKVHRAEVSMRKITNVLAFLLLAMAELAVAQNNTQVRFRNIGSETVTVVTDVGPKKIRIYVPVDPGKSEIIYVGYGSLSWCSYKGGDTTPCTPASPATGGAQVDVR
jgi:hypothetical protein